MAKNKSLVFALIVCTFLTFHSEGTLLPRGPRFSASVEKAEQLFQDALKVYDLESPDTQPWHIQANYELFNEQGESKGTGVYEELWVSGKHYKRSYTTPSFTQTDYATEQGVLRDGDQRWASQGEVMVRRSLVNPLPLRQELAKATPELNDKKFGGLKLRCVTLTHPAQGGSSAPPPVYPAYCFEIDKPTLRFESSYGGLYQTTFADPILFQGRLIAQAIQVDLRGKPFLKIHLEKIESLDPVNEADFTPPATAKRPAARKIAVSAGVAQANLVKKEDPVYPDEDKQNRIEGTVVLAASIDTDGHIAQLRTISSPDASLAAAAIDAVRRWAYKPYLLNGEVVAVDTQINVDFKLHR